MLANDLRDEAQKFNNGDTYMDEAVVMFNMVVAQCKLAAKTGKFVLSFEQNHTDKSFYGIKIPRMWDQKKNEEFVNNTLNRLKELLIAEGFGVGIFHAECIYSEQDEILISYYHFSVTWS